MYMQYDRQGLFGRLKSDSFVQTCSHAGIWVYYVNMLHCHSYTVTLRPPSPFNFISWYTHRVFDPLGLVCREYRRNFRICRICSSRFKWWLVLCRETMASQSKYGVKYGVWSPKFIWAPVHSCTLWLRPRNPPPPQLGSYTRALLVSQDRRHLLVTPCRVPWILLYYHYH